MYRIISLVRVGIVCCAAGIAAQAGAQGYPLKPVRVIINQPAGGGSDSTGRSIAQGMQELLGKPFVVENRDGASGAIGIDAVKRAEPDGHTLLFSASIVATNQVANPNASYDVLSDLTAITMSAETAYVLAVRAGTAANNARELAAHARSRELNWGISQFGGGDHFASVQLLNQFGAKALIVPFKGAGPAITAMLSGEIEVLISPPSVIIPQAAAGKVKAIGVTGLRRMDVLPNVPTVAESGFPGFEATTWFGFWGPRGMSPALASTIQQGAASALKLPRVAEFFQKAALTPVGSRPEEFAALINRTMSTYKALAASANIKVE